MSLKSKGIVYLVGAGPGDVGLMTLRGAELLKRADVVVHDALLNPEILRMARAGAEVIFAGKRAHSHAMPQEELNRLLISKAREGKCVVRLKGGDPYVFGRGGEEAEELASAGIPFEVTPGISSAIAAPNYAGIPLTHRGCASSFVVVTGHEDPAKDPGSLDWSAIAKLQGTKVVLMGAARIRPIAESLIQGGMAPSTPVAMVRWGTTGQQRSIEGGLSDIADKAEREDLSAPALAVIGEVVRLRRHLNWFEQRPLFGRRVAVTRAWDQAGRISQRLAELGAEVMEIPMIRIGPPSDLNNLKDALIALHEYDWIVFTSPNGVTHFFDYFFRGFDDLRDLGGVRIAAIGAETAAKLRELHLKVDASPDEHTARRVAEAMAEMGSLENLRVLLMRAEVANPALPAALEDMGAIIDDVACYRTLPETDDRTGATEIFVEQGADWITFLSGSAVKHFETRFGLKKILERHPRMKVASIGPETSKTLRSFGVAPGVEAKPYTAEGLVNAILKKAS